MARSAKLALIVGAGQGLSASLARLFVHEDYDVVLAARDTAKLAGLAEHTGARVEACDASDPASVVRLFEAVPAPDVVIYNPSYRVRGPLIDLDPEEVRKTLEITAFGAFLVGQQAARAMLPRKHGTIIFTGASAGVKGYPKSAPFAMGKFALRGLAQSMARELHPQGVHVAHVVIDGGIASDRRPDDGMDSLLDPGAIAETYWHIVTQPRSAWSAEVEVRPWRETF
jgi:NAD(P)-dependent dehydrogenase (short-subunit alcohol dehydrogenase family)